MESLRSSTHLREIVFTVVITVLVANLAVSWVMFTSLRREVAGLENTLASSRASSDNGGTLSAGIAPDGVYSLDVRVDPSFSGEEGKVRLVIVASLAQKMPGSEIVLLYRSSKGSSFWEEVPMTREDGVLQYSGSFVVAATDEVEYRLAERTAGEIVRATPPRTCNVGELEE